MSCQSTLTASAAAAIPWDAIVIGAGPAGTVLARHLALRGLRILIVEAKSFPREKVCGGCISRRALSELAAAGLDDLTNSLTAIPITEYEVRWSGRRFSVQRDGGLSLSRAQLDDRLLDAAVSAGAAVLLETTARVLPCDKSTGLDTSHSDPAFRHVALDQSGVRVSIAATRLVIAADGLARRSLRDLTEFTVQTASDSWIGLHAVIPVEGDSPRAGQVVMAAASGGYVGAVRIEPAPGETACRVNMAAAVSPTRLAQADNPAALISSLLEEAGVPVPAAIPSATWRGTGPLTRQSLVLAHDRVIVLGDAAGYVEPFTGEGVACAVAGANALAELLPRTNVLWSEELVTTWPRAWHGRVARGRWIVQAIRAAAHRPWLAGTAFGLAATFPFIPQFVTHQINRTRSGQTAVPLNPAGACSP